MMRIADPSVWPMVSKQRLSSWRKLKRRKGREQSGRLLAEGVRLVSEALGSGCHVDALLAADDSAGLAAARRVCELAPQWNGDTVRLTAKDYKELSDTVHGAGVIAVVAWTPIPWDEVDGPDFQSVLYCDAISDPGNLGTLFRTAAGLGLDAVIVGPGTVEPTNLKVVRASAGAVFRIPILCANTVPEVIDWCRMQGYAIYVADLDREPAAAARVSGRSGRWVLVVGGETRGPDSAWNTDRTRWLSIPMRRGVDSLNAATAGAILMDRLMQGR